MSQKNNGLPDIEKLVFYWNDFNNEYIIDILDDLDSYIERWYIKKRKDLIKKMSM